MQADTGEAGEGELKAAISVQVLSEVAGVLHQQFGAKDTVGHVVAIMSYPLEVIDLTPDIVVRGGGILEGLRDLAL
jgi:predicted nucleic acid-binding protein